MPSYKKTVAKYLNAACLKEGPVTGPIDRFEEKEVDGEDKLIIFVAGEPKGLILNKINGDNLADSFGDEMNDWVGREIEIYKDRCQMRGKMVDCCRIRIHETEA